jgi:hypothetical protein
MNRKCARAGNKIDEREAIERADRLFELHRARYKSAPKQPDSSQELG